MIRKLWLVWPRPWIVAAVFVLNIAIILLQTDPAGAVMVLCLTTVAYGIFRVMRFHPITSTEYRRWLALTPWTGREPLPRGPVELVWQDVVMVGVLMGIAGINVPAAALVIPGIFVFTYLVTLASDLWQGELHLESYALLAGLALIVRLLAHPMLIVGVFAVLYCIAIVGLRRHLRLMAREDVREIFSHSSGSVSAHERNSLGWPFRQLFPVSSQSLPSRTMTCAVAALLAWFFYVMIWIPFELAGIHSATLDEEHGGRFIPSSQEIRELMQEFEQPIQALHGLGMPVQWRYPLSLAVVLLLIRNVGPELSDWQLTGEHRLSPGFFLSNGPFLRG